VADPHGATGAKRGLGEAHDDETRAVKWRLLPGPERASASQDRAPFEEVVLPHLDSAHNLARWLVRDASLAEDVVQDAVLRALSYFSTFRGGDARAWLMRIVRNVAYGALAARQQRAGTPLDTVVPGFAGDPPALSLPDPADDPEAALTRRQDLEQLECALSTLPVELRECLVLRELEELSYKEIAHVTGVPIGTVMSRLWRARQALIGGDSQGHET
jgi:RNA polymerase sigma-70 factor, ECF subfamily